MTLRASGNLFFIIPGDRQVVQRADPGPRRGGGVVVGPGLFGPPIAHVFHHDAQRQHLFSVQLFGFFRKFDKSQFIKIKLRPNLGVLPALPDRRNHDHEHGEFESR